MTNFEKRLRELTKPRTSFHERNLERNEAKIISFVTNNRGLNYSFDEGLSTWEFCEYLVNVRKTITIFIELDVKQEAQWEIG
jgi:hypothetical protein